MPPNAIMLCYMALGSSVAGSDEYRRYEQGSGCVRGQHCETWPWPDRQIVQALGGLDGESGGHRRISLQLLTKVLIANRLRRDRYDVEQRRHQGDPGGGVPDDGGHPERQQR